MSKIYDLSKQNQMASNRKVLVSDSGKEYDVSFVPAIINRKYYKVWIDNQTEIIKIYDKYLDVYKRVGLGEKVSDEDYKVIDTLNELSKEAAESGINIVIKTMRANGYDEFSEDELLENFSEASIAEAINFIMDRVGEDHKKKIKNRKKS